MKPASEIISRPILTEKASGLAEANKYVFEVLPGADRAQIKKAVEANFKVTVEKINILIRKGKLRRSRLSGDVTWYPSEFSKFRLQCNFDKLQSNTFLPARDEQSAFLMYEIALGAHGAHKF